LLKENFMAKREVLTLLLAGGKGTRLKKLTESMAKPAVPFGGKYRIIDFVLSNCRNSGMSTVGILLQYQPHTLQNYISNGGTWELDRRESEITFLPPFQCDDMDRWYEGTAHAVAQNHQFIESYDPEFVLVLSADQIYKMDYSKLIHFHKQKAAEVTVAVTSVPWKDASRFGTIQINSKTKRILKFEEKPNSPQTNLVSMGIYLFNWQALKNKILQFQNKKETFHDFGKDIIPQMLESRHRMFAYEFHDYWKDIGTVESYWEANMDLLSAKTNPILRQKHWPIYTTEYSLPPSYNDETANISQSIIGEGCEIYGDIHKSVISYGCTIGKGSVIKNSVVLPNTVIHENVVCENVVICGNTVIDSYLKINQTFSSVLSIDKEKIKHQW